MTKTRRTLAEPEARRYLARLLRMNPLYDPGGVLALRRQTLGLAAAVRDEPIGGGAAGGDQRTAVLKELDRLRREFWSLPLEQLQKALEGIDVKRLPDVRPLVNRLRTVAACRGEFPRLAASEGAYLPLVHALKTVVVLPPAEAGPHKEQFIRSIRERQQLKAVQRTVRSIQSEYSILHQLEKDWFETLLKLKLRRAQVVPMTSNEDNANWGCSTPVIVFAALILLRLLLLALRS